MPQDLPPLATFARDEAVTEVAALLTEDEALALLEIAAARFGWAHLVWNRADAAEAARSIEEVEYGEYHLTDDEWALVHADPGWRAIVSGAAVHIAEGGWIGDALRSSGVFCTEFGCHQRLFGHPTDTGRLCGDHRTGPNGEPGVISPDTGHLFWLNGNDQLMVRRNIRRRGVLSLEHEPRLVDGTNLEHPEPIAALQRLRDLASATTAGDPS